MAIDFPNSPTNGQLFSSGTITWVYDGSKWNIQSASQSAFSPIGTIVNYGGTLAPTGWLLCNGASYNRTAYPNLFGVISTTFGQGSSPGTTFNVPDFRSNNGNFIIRANDEAVVYTTTESLLAVPIGAMQLFAMNAIPTGWLRADGSAVSRTVYADLFAAIGTTYGSGDGSTTFNLPNIAGSGAGSPLYYIKAIISGIVEPSTIAHGTTHVRGGSDVIDGDRVQVDFVPTTYTRNSAATGAGANTDLTAHLSGINNAYLPLSGGTMTGAINSASTLNLATGGTNRLNINANGQITMPVQPSFAVFRNGDIVHNASSQTNPVIFNSVTNNIGGHYNTTNGRFTAPVSGTYIFNAGIYCSVGIQQLWFIVNGARQQSFILDSTANANVAGTGIMYLNAGEWCGITPWCGGATNVTIYANGFHTYFKGALLF